MPVQIYHPSDRVRDMRVVIVRMLIRVIRWILIHLIVRPILERYVERPLYELLVAGSVGDFTEEDVELGDGEVIVDAEEDAEEGGDNVV